MRPNLRSRRLQPAQVQRKLKPAATGPEESHFCGRVRSMSRRRLGSLLSGLVVSLVAAAAFCALAWCIDDKKVFGPLARPTDEEHALVQFDKRVANEMNDARQADPEVEETQ